MQFEIKSRWNGNTVYKDEADSFAALVESAIKSDANLQGANLEGADLEGANLQNANLQDANLEGADLPAPTVVLLAAWGEVSEVLTADLMLFDSSAHPDPETFKRWAEGGPCPYQNVKVQRPANFKEQKNLWGKGKSDTIYNLMVRVLREKTKTEL